MNIVTAVILFLWCTAYTIRGPFDSEQTELPVINDLGVTLLEFLDCTNVANCTGNGLFVDITRGVADTWANASLKDIADTVLVPCANGTVFTAIWPSFVVPWNARILAVVCANGHLNGKTGP